MACSGTLSEGIPITFRTLFILLLFVLAPEPTVRLQVSMAATTREFLIMACHNLIPGWLAVVHPKFGTPSRVIIAYGVVKCEPCAAKASTLKLTISISALT